MASISVACVCQVFQDIAQQHEALREGDDIDMEDGLAAVIAGRRLVLVS